LKYNHEDLKTNLLHLGDDVLGGEGASNAMIEQGNSAYTGGILPMILGTIEGVKPMLQSFGSGLSQLNADKISLEFLVPSVRLEVKVSALLPGLTEFVEANVLN